MLLLASSLLWSLREEAPYKCDAGTVRPAPLKTAGLGAADVRDFHHPGFFAIRPYSVSIPDPVVIIFPFCNSFHFHRLPGGVAGFHPFCVNAGHWMHSLPRISD